jgi:hypothetical protein
MSKENRIRFRATEATGYDGKVDREKGIIFGVAITTEGEALGHGVFLDKEFVQDTVDNTNAKKMGLKARFGHPNASSEAFGTYIGRIKNARFDDGGGSAIARGDLYLSETAKKSPKGDLYEYVLDMAENEPDMFGTSIVFEPGRRYKRDDKGEKVFRYLEDGSYNPDFEKAESKLFTEQKRLFADDVVDEPAANPSGLFSAFSEAQPASVVTEFLDANPQIWEMLNSEDIDEIFEGFKQRYNNYKNKFQTKPKGEMEMEEKHTEAPVVEKASLSDLRAALNDDTAACEAFEAGLSVVEAKAQGFDKAKEQVVELAAQLEATLAAAENAKGADPVAHVEEKLEAEVELSVEEQRQAKLAEYADDGIEGIAAFEKLAKEHEELCI